MIGVILRTKIQKGSELRNYLYHNNKCTNCLYHPQRVSEISLLYLQELGSEQRDFTETWKQ
jgi:hypothetical protein